MGSPKVLCKVFVGGIGWGSQVRLFVAHTVVHVFDRVEVMTSSLCFLAAVERRDSRAVPRFVVAAHPVVADGRRVL